jgi:tetratricopeptide (TPR) repeat protein
VRVKRFGCFVLLLVLSASVFAQESGTEVSEKLRHEHLLASQILADIPNLKLGENRAFVYAKLGGLSCKSDAQNAHAMFEKAITELINAQQQAESSQNKSGYQNDLILSQSTRPQILNLVASCDAEFALDSLFRTRPAAVAKAISQFPTSSKIGGNRWMYNNTAQSELNMEQMLTRLAATQSPERAVALLKDSLKKGITSETLSLLTQLSEKDPTAANDAASDVVGKLVQTKFMIENQPNYQQIGTATNFLTTYTSDGATNRPLKFNDSQMRQLAGNLVSLYLQQSERYGSYVVSPTVVIQIAEKLVPSSVEALKQRQQVNVRRGDYDPELNKLLSSDASAETLVSEAKRLPVASRSSVFQTAAARFAQRGELDRALALLNENFSDEMLDQATQSLKSQYASTLMYAGRFTEAEALIDQLQDGARLSSLINLANVIYQKDPEKNKEYATAVLGKARSLVSDQPENSNEFSNLMQIITAYGNITPTEAFRTFEPLIPQMNELTDAYATVNQFQGGGNVRQGEYLMSQGANFGYYYDPSIFRTLAKNDFDRTMRLIDGFSRREVRLGMQLQLAEMINNQ